jgi:hypothetical protein
MRTGARPSGSPGSVAILSISAPRLYQTRPLRKPPSSESLGIDDPPILTG